MPRTNAFKLGTWTPGKTSDGAARYINRCVPAKHDCDLLGVFLQFLPAAGALDSLWVFMFDSIADENLPDPFLILPIGVVSSTDGKLVSWVPPQEASRKLTLDCETFVKFGWPLNEGLTIALSTSPTNVVVPDTHVMRATVRLNNNTR